MKVAYFSPMPPETSGIADYSALLVPALGRRVELTIVRRGARRPPRGTDLPLYHIGNDPQAHGWILDALERVPGMVVLHDFVLHHLVSGTTLGRGNSRGYLDALERDGGLAARLLGYAVMEKRIPALWESRAEELPLAAAVLDRATALIVHSRYVERRARETGYENAIHVVPHPAWPAPPVTPAAVAGAPLFGCFGNLNASKRIPQLLEAFARLHRDRPEARLLLVGGVSPGFDLDRRLQRLGLSGEGIIRMEYVPEEQLWALMAACDVCLNLRAPTMGETSGSVIRQLSLGKPVVVSDVGWFSELPDEVALKIPVDEREVDVLHAALELLSAREDVRVAMGEAAAALARREHDLEHVAELYAAALELAAGGAAVAESVLRDVSRAAAEVGIDAGAPEAVELAQRLAEVELGVCPESGRGGWHATRAARQGRRERRYRLVSARLRTPHRGAWRLPAALIHFLDRPLGRRS